MGASLLPRDAKGPPPIFAVLAVEGREIGGSEEGSSLQIGGSEEGSILLHSWSEGGASLVSVFVAGVAWELLPPSTAASSIFLAASAAGRGVWESSITCARISAGVAATAAALVAIVIVVTGVDTDAESSMRASRVSFI